MSLPALAGASSSASPGPTDWDKLASEFLSKNKVFLPALAGASRSVSLGPKDWDKLAKEYGVFLAKNMVSEKDLNVHLDEALEALIQGLNSSTALTNEDKLKVRV